MNSNNTLKAGIFDPYLDTLGGGERYTLTIAEILSQNGYNVDIFWSGDPDILSRASKRFSLDLSTVKITPDIFNQPPFSLDLVDDPVDITAFHNSSRPALKTGRFQSFFNRYRVLKQYDLFFYLSDGSLPFLFSRKNLVHFQVPFLFSHQPASKLLNLLKFKFIHRIICNSEFTQKVIDNSFDCHSTVLYPPVDIEKFSPGTKENIILSVGRFDNVLNAKKQDVLIQAFGKLLEKDPSLKWRLILAGGSLENPEKNQYLQHLKYLAKNLPVEFDVNPDFEKLKEIYSISKIYWHAAGFDVDQISHPENTEHFGITVVEAMASGLVPVVVAQGGLPEIIRDGQNGYLWNNPETLVAKTRLLISTHDLAKLSQAAINDSQQFSKKEFAVKFLKLID